MKLKYYSFLLAFFCLNFTKAQTTPVVTGLGQPSSIAFHGDDLYIAEVGAYRISIKDVTTGGTNITGELASADRPVSLTMDGDNLYVGHEYSGAINRINVVNNTGVQTVFSSLPSHGTAVRGSELFVAQRNSGQIMRVNLVTGATTTFISGLQSPYGLAFKGDDLYVSEFNANRISKIDVTAAPNLTTVIDGLVQPSGIAFYGNNLYVAESAAYRIGVIDVTAATPNNNSIANGSVNIPKDVAIRGNELYIAESQNSMISKLTLPVYVPPVIPATHLNFDGSNDYVELANESNFDFTTEMTVEFWMNSTYANPEQWDGLITKGDDSWRLHLNASGTVNFACSGTSTTSEGNSTTVVTDGNWHHIAATLGNNTIRLYIDGVEEFTTAAPEALNNSSFPVTIGQNLQQGGRFYYGNMEDVRIWNVTRTAEQIKDSKNCELQGNETGLVAYYKFNQGNDKADNTTEITAIDATGTNNGTLNNFSLIGETSNWLAGSPVTTGSIIPTAATVSTPVTYNQGDAASALMATTGTNGTGLLWYTTTTGGSGFSTAPTPSTVTVGETSYWVSSVNANGCESERTEIVVEVNGMIPATHLDFGGANDYVDCGSDPSLEITGNTITLEAYVKFNSFGAAHWLGNIINKASPNASGYMLRAGGNGAVNFVVANFGWHELTTADNTITLDTWFHIAGVYNGTTSKIYVDGIEVASTNIAMGNIGNSAFNANLGRDPQDTVRGLDASLDDVRIWNIARTAEQINASKNCELQGSEAGLVAYYKFNQGVDAADNASETTVIDATGTNNGTLTNFDLTGTTSNWLAGSPMEILPSAPTVTTPVTYTQGDTASPLTATTGSNGTGLLWYATATGGMGDVNAPTPDTSVVGETSYWVTSTNANGCESERTEIVVEVNAIPQATHINFDGVDDHIILPNESNYDFTTDLTIEFMIKTTFFDGLDGFITKGNSSWRIHGGLNGTVMFAGNNSFNDFASTTSIDDDSWHHVAVTYNGSAAKIYVDGVLESSYAASNSIQNNSDPIAIGAMKENTYTSRFFNGSIDEVRIWNIARTEEQIFGSKDCELQGTETGLVSYYKFNQGIDAGDNTAITTATDGTASGNDGSINNMALTGTTSNFLAGSPMITGKTLPSMPTVATPVTYYQGDTASALTATTGAYGTGLLWYATATGGMGDVNAPTPDTSVVGATSYWVTSTNANGCESERTEIVVNIDETLGINQNEGLDNIRVYPNPTNSLLHVSNINGIDIQASIYDINGRLLLDKNCDQELNTIDISTFSNGIYLLRMKTDFHEITKRVIKE